MPPDVSPPPFIPPDMLPDELPEFIDPEPRERLLEPRRDRLAERLYLRLDDMEPERRLLLFQFRAADAWPLLGFPEGWAAYEALMACGRSGPEPRLAPVPVRLPLPPASLQGSIYENQKGLRNRFFAAPVEVAAE